MGHSRIRIALAAALAVAFTLPAAAATSTWQMDPMHTAAQFSVRHLAISTVRGGFSKVTGTVTFFDDKDASKSSVRRRPSMSPPWTPANLVATKT